MKNSLLFLALIFTSSSAYSANIDIYNLDFESSVQPYSVGFGTPTIQPGGLDGNSLVFNADTTTYEQIRLNMGNGFSRYNIAFDLLTNNLVGSLYNFGISLDTPLVQNLDFHGSVGLSTFNANSDGPANGGIFGSFSDNQRMRVEIDVDIVNSLWTINVDNGMSYAGVFNSNDGDINSLRFTLSPWNASAGLDAGVSVALDNLVVSASVVPVPAAVWLFGSGLLGLFGVARRKAVI